MNQAVQNLIVGSVEEGALALGGLDVAEAMEVGAKMDTEKNLAPKESRLNPSFLLYEESSWLCHPFL